MSTMFQQARTNVDANPDADTSLGLDDAAAKLEQGIEQTFDQILEDEKIDLTELSSLTEMHAEQMAESQLTELMTELDTNGDGHISMDEMREGATKDNLSRMVQEGIVTEEMAQSMEELARHHRVHGAKSVHGPGEEQEGPAATVDSPETELEPASLEGLETGATAEVTSEPEIAEPTVEDILKAMGTAQEQPEPTPVEKIDPSMEDILQSVQAQNSITESTEPSVHQKNTPGAQEETLAALATERAKILKNLGIEMPEPEVPQEDHLKTTREDLGQKVEPEEIQSLSQDPEEQVAQQEVLSAEEQVAEPNQENETRFDKELTALTESLNRDRTVDLDEVISHGAAEPNIRAANEELEPLSFDDLIDQGPALATDLETLTQHLTEETETVGVSGVKFENGQLVISLKG